MTRIRRLANIIFGIACIVAAILLIVFPHEGAPIILQFLALGLGIRGINNLIYYFTMARFMVGGKIALYVGIIYLDFGVFSAAISDDIPKSYIILYLVIIHAFAGAVEILRSFEAKGCGDTKWRLKLIHGIVDIGMALICIILIKNLSVTVIVFSLGLIYSAILRIISAFNKTTMVYIQ